MKDIFQTVIDIGIGFIGILLGRFYFTKKYKEIKLNDKLIFIIFEGTLVLLNYVITIIPLYQTRVALAFISNIIFSIGGGIFLGLMWYQKWTIKK